MRRAAAVAGLLALVAAAPEPPPPKPKAEAPAKERKMNRLAKEKSPYLLQHKENPVDWYPWGEEAISKAKSEGKPIFLSVGYSTCHWCHVMERESFESGEIAAVMNRSFVSVKVDREERPDIDGIYMTAVQMMTGSGGWPMSVFLTPDGKPFFAGTYFPPDDRFGRPGFKRVLETLADEWARNRGKVEAQADRVAADLKRAEEERPERAASPPGREAMEGLLEDLSKSFDARHGGFGGAPKFPPHGALRALLVEAGRGNREARRMLLRTLGAMADGGIRDHLGGGFHRYSTDPIWLVPHFEKMLYDNALLAGIYAEASALAGDEGLAAASREACEFILRELTGKEGGLLSALDADSEGTEGKFYVWTADEIRGALGREDADAFSVAHGVEEAGNFEEGGAGANILYLPRPLDDLARGFRVDPGPFRARMEAARAKLLAIRSKRIRPHLDDKVLADWNGLGIGGLARAGRFLKEPRFVEAAAKAAGFVLGTLRDKDGRLLHAWREGEARIPGFLEDHAFLADGLLDLHEATSEARWLDEAKRLADAMIERFEDKAEGGFFRTSVDHEALLLRSKETYDGALPSGNSMAARVLVRLAGATGEARYADAADRTLATFRGLVERVPRAVEWMVLAAAMRASGKAPPPAAAEAPDGSARSGPVVAEAFLSASKVAPGDTVKAAVRLTLAPRHHVQANDPGWKDGIPTVLEAAPPDGVTAGPVAYPAGTEFRLAGERILVYEGGAILRLDLRAAADAKPGKRAVRLVLKFQACDDRSCLAPAEVSLDLPLEIVDTPPAEKPRHPAIFP